MDRGKVFAYFRELCLELEAVADEKDWRATMKRFYALNPWLA